MAYVPLPSHRTTVVAHPVPSRLTGLFFCQPRDRTLACAACLDGRLYRQRHRSLASKLPLPRRRRRRAGRGRRLAYNTRGLDTEEEEEGEGGNRIVFLDGGPSLSEFQQWDFFPPGLSALYISARCGECPNSRVCGPPRPAF